MAGKPELISTGIPGLDEIANGGLFRGRTYLIEGGPGTGKTTLALHFMMEGVRRQERCLYISVAGAGEEICTIASQFKFFLDMKFVQVHEIGATETTESGGRYRMFRPSEVELSETMRGIFDMVQRVQPERIVFDSLLEFRLLTEDMLNFRRELLALRNFFAGSGRTVLVTDSGGDGAKLDIAALAFGVIHLKVEDPAYGPSRRRLSITKFRGKNVRTGWHDFTISAAGMTVFPRLAATDSAPPEAPAVPLLSDLPELDLLTGGGISRGTSTAIIGPAGTGKSTLAMQYAMAATKRGEPVGLYIFEESHVTYKRRAGGIGSPANEWLKEKTVLLRQVNPVETPPGEFTAMIGEDVERCGVRVVVIDSLNAFISAIEDPRSVVIQLHELFAFLGSRMVATFLTVNQHGIDGLTIDQSVPIGYLTDNILLLRFFETGGEVRRAVSVVKKRGGSHERSTREMNVSEAGLQVGEPLRSMRGLLTGVPVLEEEQ